MQEQQQTPPADESAENRPRGGRTLGDVLIEAENVERVYRSGDTSVYALRSINLTIRQGEYVSLMGPSGSGKTTFFNMVGALDFPTDGEVRIGGRNLQELSSPQLAYLRCVNIGYIFQNYNLIEVFTALDNVKLPMKIRGVDDDEASDRARHLLDRVGLGERYGHLPGELSGGQQQRVAIARALANNPSLMLADEPTGNLDSKTGHAIVDLLSELSTEHGVTVVSATHDHRMLDVSDRVVYLRDGMVERIVSREDLKISIGSVG
jgi:putative ABC transport system ATP-binding protein